MKSPCALLAAAVVLPGVTEAFTARGSHFGTRRRQSTRHHVTAALTEPKSNYKVTLLPGDGIGPEITEVGTRVRVEGWAGQGRRSRGLVFQDSTYLTLHTRTPTPTSTKRPRPR